MDIDAKTSDPNVQEPIPPQMPDSIQEALPTYSQAVNAPAYHQPPYPTQFTPVSQPMVYQPVQYVDTMRTAPPVMAAYHQPPYPTQFTPASQPMVYQPVQYVDTVSRAPPGMAAGVQPVYSDYMCWSVMSTLFCCLPIGLVACFYSLKTQDALARQDIHSARAHSYKARGLNISAMGCGVVLNVFFIALIIMRTAI